MNKTALPLLVSTFLAGWLGCRGDACDGDAGTCLTLEVRAGQSLQINRLVGDIRGATLRLTVDHIGEDIDTPFQYALTNVPDASGEATISVAAFFSDKLVAIGRTTFVIAPGARVRVPIALQSASTPTCSDGVRDGDESDIDCGGPCMKRCTLGDSCRGMAFMDCESSTPCLNQICSLCSSNADCSIGTCHMSHRCY